MSMNRHQHFEELISASLADDLSDAERAQLDAHLDGCAACRATLASFAEQRRIMAGLRHVAAPRDLGARVRAGVEGGAFAPVPWWRRPAVMFGGLGGGLAAVAGALLAIVLLNGSPEDPNVGLGSISPAPSTSLTASSTPAAESPGPSATPGASEAAASPSASAAPVEASPEPDLYFAYTGAFDNLALSVVHGPTGETIAEIDAPLGPPIAAELSPDGQWLAYVAELGQSGLNEVHLTRIAARIPADDPSDPPFADSPIEVGRTVSLGRSVAGSPFLERLAWSRRGHYLAYTLAAPEGGGTDAWVFDVTVGESQQVTNFGDAYAGSWMPESLGTSLWLSRAGEQPVSYGLQFNDSGGGPSEPGDEVNGSTAAVNAFQPLLSPDGSRVIYWKGVMGQAGDVWTFIEGGAPYLADAPVDDNPSEFTNERPLFGDVTIDRDAFTSASIVWGADSDAYAVWNAQWTGIPQGANGEYPSPRRVYFGHASDSRGLTEDHAIDEADIPEGSSVVDVKVTTGRHLVITALRPVGGVMEAPAADLFIVTRNTGRVADDVTPVRSADDGWFGPAAYDASSELSAP